MADNGEVGFDLMDFEQSDFSLDDMQERSFSSAKVDNPASTMNAAAQAAMLSDDPEELVETFNNTMINMEEGNASDVMNGITSKIRSQVYDEVVGDFTSFLADPQYTDEEKRQAADVLLDKDGQLYSPQALIATESIIAEDSGTPHPEQEEARINVAETIYETQQIKKAKQAALNQAVAGSTVDGVTATADFLGAITPFVESSMMAKIKADLDENPTQAFYALGNAKQEIIDGLRAAPLDEQMRITEELIKVVNSNSSVVMADPNDFARVNFLRTFLEEGYYTDTDKWLDNIVGVLDFTVFGGPLARGVRRFKRMFGDDVSNSARDVVRSQVAPVSASQTMKSTNVEKARNIHEAAATDESGTAAQALYGTTREDAVMNDLMPEVGKTDGSVADKVGNPDLNITDIDRKDGAIYFTEAEKKQLRADAVNKLVQVNGMTARKEMFSIEEAASGVKVRAIYGPTQKGFTDPEDAIEMAKWALRDYGADVQDLSLLRRDGDEYVPITLQEAKALKVVDEVSGEKLSTTDFLIGFDYNYKFNPTDVVKWSEFDVNYNIFDRLSATSDSSLVAKTGNVLQRYALDPQSMLDEHLTLAANVAVDKAAGLEEQLLKLGKEFADGFTSVDLKRQSIIEDIIKQQNHEGRVLSKSELDAQGITPKEQQVLTDWKRYWDNIYDLENKDFANSLRNKGYKEFVSVETDTRMFVKPLRRQDAKPALIYDDTTDSIRPMGAQELDALYENGGKLVRIKDPINVNGEVANFMRVDNAVNTNYLRGIREDAQVLNYRPGYYTVNYTDPYFITRTVKTADGDITKAVATAGSVKDAELLMKRMAKNEPDETVSFGYRFDKKGSAAAFEDRWDVAMNSGRSVQRRRGERLGTNHDSGGLDPSQAPILGPVDSMILSARSTSNRVHMRKPIEAMKQRFMAQYGDVLPENEFKAKTWPNEAADIRFRDKGTEDSRKIADARTTWEYINYLENGYINIIDDGTKNALKAISKGLGKLGLPGEKTLMKATEGRGVSALGKSLAFNMYLATNPARQFIVQGHQAVQLGANFPDYFASGRFVPEFLMINYMQFGRNPPKSLLKLNNMTLSEAQDMYKQFKDSGIIAAIDKQNLVRGALADMADQVANKDFKPLTLVRKAGFDMGENINMTSAWLAHRYRAINDGLDMKDAAVADRVSGKARNYTYNMNAAGDMRYNQDALAVLFQFMQVPHKALMQMTTNRILTKQEKIRLATYNAMMYTLPPAAMYEIFSSMGLELPEDKLTRDLVVQGLEGVVFNKLLALTFEDEAFTQGENLWEKLGDSDTDVDFSGLSPIDMYGTYDFLHALVTTGPIESLANTPSGQLFFGYNPRVSNLIKTTGRFLGIGDYEETPTDFAMVVQDFSKLSSGMSNFFKAKYRFEAGKTASGLDMDVKEHEAVMQVLGFGTVGEAQARWVGDKTYRESKALKDDVRTWYSDYKKQLFRDGIEPDEQEYIMRTYKEAWRAWDGTLRDAAMNELKTLIKRDITNKDVRLYNHILKSAGYTDAATFRNLIQAMPESESWDKDKIDATVEYILKYTEE